MNDEALYLLLAEENHHDRLSFQQALKEIKVNTVLDFVCDGAELLDLLGQQQDHLPHVVFLDLDLPSKGALEYLTDIRRESRHADLVVAIVAADGSDQIMQEAFVRGANIFLHRTNEFDGLTCMLSQAISIFWQYYTSGFRRDNFILNISQHHCKGGQNKTRLYHSNGW
ncbi:MAG: response regulator [Bacteroidales bacterium]